VINIFTLFASVEVMAIEMNSQIFHKEVTKKQAQFQPWSGVLKG
jgi:hypothetical protein